jgi:hypothetical protein
MVDALERLQVLLTQETTHYFTSDYLNRRPEQTSSSNPTESSISTSNTSSNPKKRKSLLTNHGEHSISTFSPCESSASSPNRHSAGLASKAGSSQEVSSSSSAGMNKQWREKICEWSYEGKRLEPHGVSNILRC